MRHDRLLADLRDWMQALTASMRSAPDAKPETIREVSRAIVRVRQAFPEMAEQQRSSSGTADVPQKVGTGQPAEGTCKEGGDSLSGLKPEDTGTTKVGPAVPGSSGPSGEGAKRKPVRNGFRAIVAGEDFERFWTAYPRKVGKRNALRAFQRLSAEDALAAIEDVSIRATRDPDWTKDGGTYVPHPATYLNGRRWEDEWAKLAAPVEEYPGQAAAKAEALRLMQESK